LINLQTSVNLFSRDICEESIFLNYSAAVMGWWECVLRSDAVVISRSHKPAPCDPL